MKTQCNVVWDLIPLYIDEVCSEESKRIVEDHLNECDDCKNRLEFLKNEEYKKAIFEPKLDALKKIKKINTRKTIWVSITALLVIILIIALWGAFKHVYNVVDTVWSDDGTRLFVVYDCPIGVDDIEGNSFTLKQYTNLSGKRSESFFLRWLGGKNRSRTNIVYGGVYETGEWSPDGSKFIVNAGVSDSYLYILDVVHNNSRNINFLLEGSVANGINSNPEQFGYGLPDEPEISLEFLQWSEDSSFILIYFKLIDSLGIEQSGYCWYNYENNTVDSFLN